MKLAHKDEWAFASVISATHGAQHFFTRLLPPLIPVLAVRLELPLWKLGMLITVFAIGAGLGQTPFGILSDKYDRRYLLTPGLAVLSFGYVLFSFAPSLGAPLPTIAAVGTTFSGPYQVMVGTMLLSGIGASVVHPTGYPLLSANVGDARKGRALGMWGSVAKLGDAASPAVIGVLILALTWDRILLVLGLAGLVYAAVLFVVLSAPAFETRPYDQVQAEEAADDEEAPESAENVWRVDPRIFVYPMLAVLLFFATRVFVIQGVNTYVPAFIVDVYGYTFGYFGLDLQPESFANFYFSALLITAAVVQVFTGTVTDIYDPRKVLIGFLGVSAAALAVLSQLTLGPLALLVVLLVVGAGLWGLNPARDTLISDITPPEREGRTFGYLWTLGHLVGSVSPVLIGLLAEGIGIQDSFKYLALMAFVSALAVGLLFSDRVWTGTPTSAEPAD